MGTGKTVILLNLESLYESLYDAMNQFYVKFGEDRYVDLGLGTHRVKCRVHNDFRLIVVADKQAVYKRFPIPLINRLEKHFLSTTTMLTSDKLSIAKRLDTWAHDFAHIRLNPGQTNGSTFDVQDAFIDYCSDTPALIVANISSSVTKQDYQDEKEWENRVLELSQDALLACAVPDAILRLPGSVLCDPEDPYDSAQRIGYKYNFEQNHRSLAEYIKCEIKLDQEKKNNNGILAQVTTHSRLLLPWQDLSEVAKVLNLQPRKLRQNCLFLQEFETENQFTEKIREFFMDTSSDDQMMIIQCEGEIKHTNLIECSRYIVQNERNEVFDNGETDHKFSRHVVFIIQLPRFAGSCSHSLLGGKWRSVHIDEIRSPHAESPDTSAFEDRPLGAIFESRRIEDSPRLVNTVALLISCVHAATASVEDVEGNRKRKRVKMLLRLLKSEDDVAKLTFANVIKARICQLLKERDERIGHSAAQWLCNEAMCSEKIQINGTFRRTVWQKLKTVVTPILAEVIAFADKDDNLDILTSPQGSWKHQLWLEILRNPQLAVMTYDDFLSPINHLPREIVPVLSTSNICYDFPFFWVVKTYIDRVLQSGIATKATGANVLEYKFKQLLQQSEISEMCVMDDNHPYYDEIVSCYFTDFLRNMLRTTDSEDKYMNVIRKAITSAAFANFITNKAKDKSSFVMSVADIHVTYHNLHTRLQYLEQIVKIFPAAVDLSLEVENEMVIDVYSLLKLLENLEKTQLSEYEKRTHFVSMMHKARPIVEKMHESERQSKELYGNKSQQYIADSRNLWKKLCVVKSFVDHLCPDTNVGNENAKKIVHLLKAFDKHKIGSTGALKVVETVLKMANKVAQEKYFRLGNNECRFCTEAVTEPVILPCDHVYCLKCVQPMFDQLLQRKCMCKKPVSEDFKIESTTKNKENVAAYTRFRRQCNSFFMEYISLYCFTDEQPPEMKLIERLMSHVTLQTGDKVETKRPSPFSEESVDQTPVVRSFVLQLLLRYSDNNVRTSLQDYLSKTGNVVKTEQDILEFSSLSIQCIEDALYNKVVKIDSNSKLSIIHDAILIIEKAIQFRLEEPDLVNIDQLEHIASVRFGLTVTAEVMYQYCSSNPQRNQSGQQYMQYVWRLMEVAKTYCEKCDSSLPRDFLLKQLCRRYGSDCLQSIIHDQRGTEWLLPADLIVELEVPDRYIICGNDYRKIRQVIIELVKSSSDDKFIHKTIEVNTTYS
ncbi:E3 ubiquitin-protein ligase rnf213-alpha-like [Saccoglossus kowalevskii]